jgi:hypothetical protein
MAGIIPTTMLYFAAERQGFGVADGCLRCVPAPNLGGPPTRNGKFVLERMSSFPPRPGAARQYAQSAQCSNDDRQR